MTLMWMMRPEDAAQFAFLQQIGRVPFRLVAARMEHDGSLDRRHEMFNLGFQPRDGQIDLVSINFKRERRAPSRS